MIAQDFIQIWGYGNLMFFRDAVCLSVFSIDTLFNKFFLRILITLKITVVKNLVVC